MKLDKWHLIILALLALAVIGIYALLIRMISYQINGEASDRLVEVVAPLDGTVAQIGTFVTVQAMVTGPDLNRLEFWTDDAPLFVSSRSLPADTDVWTVSGQWAVGWPGEHRLFVRGFAAGGEMIISEPVTLWAVPKGHLIFTSKRNEHYAIYRSRLDGGELERLFTGEGDSREPAVNHRGLIALTQILAGQHRGLWQVDPATRSAGILMEDAANLSQAAWTPDGRQIAYVSNRSGSDQVWVADADGGVGEMITDEPISAGGPSWGPNGLYLVYTGKQADNWDISRVQSNGQGLSRLTRSPSVDWQPAWSPVADQIAFVSNRSGEYQVFVMDADGNNPRQLTYLIGGAEQPRWSPDGTWIAFVGYSGEGEGLNARELYVMRSDGKDQIRLTYNDVDDTEPVWMWPDDTAAPMPALQPATVETRDSFAGTYFDNMTLSSEPVMARDDRHIGFDWGLGSPVAGMPTDHFSARWTATLQLPETGDYLFDLQVDDGARLWVDDTEIIDLWGQKGLSEVSVPVYLEAGEHLLRLEYYENTELASISLSWSYVHK